VEHAHLLEEHGAGRTALRQHEVVLADAQAREVDACTTADALLQATRAAEDHATQVGCIATLAEREVGFLKSLNVCSPLDYSLSLSSLGSHKQTSYASEEAMPGSGYIDRAEEQHIKELESQVSEYKAHIQSLDTEIQELSKRPMLDEGSGLQVLHDKSTNEKDAVQEARRGTSRRLHHGKTNTFPHVLFTSCTGREEGSNAEGRGQD